MRAKRIGWAPIASVVAGMGWLAACGGAGDVGASGGECFPDRTCGSGLWCSSDFTCVGGTGGAGGGTGGAGGGGPAPEPTCRSVTLTNTSAGDKTNAAFCIGLGYPLDSYSCTYDSTQDVTDCEGEESSYYVDWEETDDGTVGIAFDGFDDTPIAAVSQSASGDFVIFFDALDLAGVCAVSGDTAQLCVEPVAL